MQKLLAVVVLGASLAFASSAAFAGDRGVVEPVSQPTQPAASGYDTGYGTVVQPPHPAWVVQFTL
jgi:hypothetical protein